MARRPPTAKWRSSREQVIDRGVSAIRMTRLPAVDLVSVTAILPSLFCQATQRPDWLMAKVGESLRESVASRSSVPSAQTASFGQKQIKSNTGSKRTDNGWLGGEDETHGTGNILTLWLVVFGGRGTISANLRPRASGTARNSTMACDFVSISGLPTYALAWVACRLPATLVESKGAM